MRGWDDPRMPTIKGLRRRGYTPNILNAFCREIGATRNANIVQYERLAAIARLHLHEMSPRVMAVLKPLKIILKSDSIIFPITFTVPDFPFDPSRGNHSITIDSEVIIFKVIILNIFDILISC